MVLYLRVGIRGKVLKSRLLPRAAMTSFGLAYKYSDLASPFPYDDCVKEIPRVTMAEFFDYVDFYVYHQRLFSNTFNQKLNLDQCIAHRIISMITSRKTPKVPVTMHCELPYLHVFYKYVNYVIWSLQLMASVHVLGGVELGRLISDEFGKYLSRYSHLDWIRVKELQEIADCFNANPRIANQISVPAILNFISTSDSAPFDSSVAQYLVRFYDYFTENKVKTIPCSVDEMFPKGEYCIGHHFLLELARVAFVFKQAIDRNYEQKARVYHRGYNELGHVVDKCLDFRSREMLYSVSVEQLPGLYSYMCNMGGPARPCGPQ